MSKYDSDQDYADWRDRYNEPNGRMEPKDRCEQCWRDAYGSVPGHVFCREHFMEHQAKVIAEIAAKSQKGAA